MTPRDSVVSPRSMTPQTHDRDDSSMETEFEPQLHTPPSQWVATESPFDRVRSGLDSLSREAIDERSSSSSSSTSATDGTADSLALDSYANRMSATSVARPKSTMPSTDSSRSQLQQQHDSPSSRFSAPPSAGFYNPASVPPRLPTPTEEQTRARILQQQQQIQYEISVQHQLQSLAKTNQGAVFLPGNSARSRLASQSRETLTLSQQIERAIAALQVRATRRIAYLLVCRH